MLANLAMHEEFRGSFASLFSPGATAGGGVDGGGRASTVAAVLVIIAGDVTVRFHARVVRAPRCSCLAAGRKRRVSKVSRSLWYGRRPRKQGGGWFTITPSGILSPSPLRVDVLGAPFTNAQRVHARTRLTIVRTPRRLQMPLPTASRENAVVTVLIHVTRKG